MTLEELKNECERCNKCSLCQTRKNLVFGVGNENASLMFIGEAPGASEDEQGIPFVGRAGQLFDKFLYQVDIDRNDVYIANMLKCRPPENRDPKDEEMDVCIGWLRQQFKCIRPKMIVCLGRISAMRLISPDYRITQQHGQFVEKSGVLMTAVYHPSYLLRNPSKKPEMLEDMKMIRQKLDEMN